MFEAYILLLLLLVILLLVIVIVIFLFRAFLTSVFPFSFFVGSNWRLEKPQSSACLSINTATECRFDL